LMDFPNFPRDRLRIFDKSNILISVQNALRSFKASILQALAHPSRIAILEVLKDGELPAGTIQERIGVEQANLSQHLAVLRSRQIIVNRKEGNQVFYSLRDPMLLEVLEILRRYFQANLSQAIAMLEEVEGQRQQP
jgi:DNA-binding transcriptional ArsR family regulator